MHLPFAQVGDMHIVRVEETRLTYPSLASFFGQVRIRGTLTMHGVSKEVLLDTEYLGRGKDPWGNTRYGFHAETKVNRKDFGMAWNEVAEAGGLLVGDEVEVVLDVEAVPVQP